MLNANFITLIHYLICLGCLIYTLYASAFLLFKKPEKNVQVSRTPITILYFWFTSTSSILLLINVGYAIILWRPNEIIYNPTALYYIAGIPTIYVNLVPIADFFLCAGRCCSVAFPLMYRKTFKTILASIFGGTVAGIFLLYILVTKWFAFSTKDTTTTCAFYICLVYQLNYPMIISYAKYTFCTLNVIAPIILLICIYLRKSTQLKFLNKLNKSVLKISIINIVFAFIPGLMADVYYDIWKVRPMEIIGDYNLTLVSINITLCVNFYLRVFRKLFLKVIEEKNTVTTVRSVS